MKRLICGLLAALLLLLPCVSCAREEAEEDGQGYVIYCLANPEEAGGGDAIVGVPAELELPEGAELTAQAAAIVEKVMTGVDGYASPLPEGIQLRGIEISGRRAYVDFSARYAALTGIRLSLADYCVTLSLTQLEGISAVSITANGQDLFYRDSTVMMSRDVLLSSMEDVLETVSVELYFQDEDGQLAAEQRNIDLYEGQTLAESLISALLEGPESRELAPLLPEEFVINGIRVENGICYLSIPGTSLETLPDDPWQQELILRSLGSSIYSMEGVDEICLLADGGEIQAFGEVPVDIIRLRPEEEEQEN